MRLLKKVIILICKQGEAAQMAARLAESQASLGELDDALGDKILLGPSDNLGVKIFLCHSR